MVERFFNRLGQIGGGLILSGVLLTRFTFVVDGGERAVIFNKLRGVQNKVYGEGMHLLIPLLMVTYTKFSAIHRSPRDSKSDPSPKPFTLARVPEICRTLISH